MPNFNRLGQLRSDRNVRRRGDRPHKHTTQTKQGSLIKRVGMFVSGIMAGLSG